MICNYYKQKWKYRFDRKIKIWLGNIRSNQVFYWKPNMILWSLRSFWVERFDLNQSQKIDFRRKSFLCQFKNSARNRFSPRSRLGQMTYRKLKLHASWPLQMRRGVTPPRCIAIAWGSIPPRRWKAHCSSSVFWVPYNTTLSRMLRDMILPAAATLRSAHQRCWEQARQDSGNYGRLRNSDGWRDVFWRLFRTRSVMGRLWDDHFRDLGYPPKFYRGQDAGFDSGSSI